MLLGISRAGVNAGRLLVEDTLPNEGGPQPAESCNFFPIYIFLWISYVAHP